MTRKARIWLACVAGFVAWLVTALYVPGWIGLSAAGPSWLLRGLLAVIGLVGCVLIATTLTRRQPPPSAPRDPLGVEMEAALAQAEQRLVAARVARGRVLHRLPAVFVMGPRQNHKTSSVIRSGVEAELLSGDVLRGAQVVPTQTINTWYAGGALLVEVGTDVVEDAGRFGHLLHRLQPARFASAVTRGEQAPRAVLLAFSCDNLRQPNARDVVMAAARELRAPLAAIARTYGIRLPVYVLFTKADAIPGFNAFARRLSSEEVRDVLGATLPIAPDLPAAAYADRASALVRGEVQALFESLASRRVDLLLREDIAADRALAYQFPRELRKLEPLIADFLVELGRPSELSTSPFVRGFYMSGVREVFVGDGAAEQTAAGTAVAAEGENATMLLGAAARTPTPRPFPRGGAGPRREAQWVFLDRLISQVLLNDAAALGLTRGGTRISLFRRIALATATGVVAALIVALVGSFLGNRRLQSSARQHLAALAAVPADSSAGTVVARLPALDALGGLLDTLSDREYAITGAPIWLRFGLYQGDALYGVVSRAYFRGFAPMLDSVQRSLVAGFLALPPGSLPPAAFETVRAQLRAYLVTTDSARQSNGDSLASVLLAQWSPDPAADSASRDVARRQFMRYARELKRRPPYQRAPDAPAVAAARGALRNSEGAQVIYGGIIQDVSSKLPEMRFTGGGGALTVSGVVRGAFTRAGRDSIAMADVNSYRDVEPWVLGPRPADTPPPDTQQVRVAMRTWYERDYRDEWRRFIRTARVVGFQSPADAARKLSDLASATGPLQTFFREVNDSLVPDTTGIGLPFAPVRRIAAQVTQWGPYLDELRSLGEGFRGAAAAENGAQASSQLDGIEEGMQSATRALNALQRALASGANGPTYLGELDLQALLNQPLEYARRVVNDQKQLLAQSRAGPTAGTSLASAVKQFCDEYRAIAGKAPFNPSIPLRADATFATPAEVTGFFGPNGGTLWTLPQSLQRSIAVRVDSFVPGDNTKLQPTDSALAFANALSRIKRALFPAGAAKPYLEWRVAPVIGRREPRVQVAIGDSTITWEEGNSGSTRPFSWRFEEGKDITIQRETGRNRWQVVATWSGPWAPFLFFDGARRGAGAPGNEFQFTVRLNDGSSMEFRASIPAASRAVLLGGILQGVPACPTHWTR